MMKKLLILLTLIFALACTCTAFAGAGTDKNANMEKITSTSAGDLYLDKDNLQALRQGDKLFLLVSAELRYNKEMLPKLQATKPELKTAISMTQIYLYITMARSMRCSKACTPIRTIMLFTLSKARPICSLSKASCRCCCTKER